MTIEVFFTGTGMPDPGWREVLWPDPAKVLAETGMRSGDRAVDLCCGDGWFTVPMAKAASVVTAIDIDPRLLERTGARLAASGIANCALVEADAYDVAEVVSEADYVLLANAFHGVPDRVRLAAAIREALRPGRLLAIVNWHRQPRELTPILGEPRGPATDLRMSPTETMAPVEAAGLVHKFTVEVSPYHYGAVFERG